MKLFDIVKQCQAAGLKVGLHVAADGKTLCLAGETVHSKGDRGSAALVTCAILGGKSGEFWGAENMHKQIAKAALHPDAIAQREWEEEFKKLCTQNAKDRASAAT